MKISFIVQGPVINTEAITTIQVVDSIRFFYPSAEIILSTWENENTTGIGYDKIVINKDPGCFQRNDGLLINVNRQIVSTYEGLKVAENNFVVKLRTDTKIISNGIFEVLSKLKEAKLFDNYVAVSELFTRDPFKINLLFHPSDLIYIGYQNDLLKLFSIKLASKDDMLNKNGNSIICPEQYIWLRYLLDHHNLNFFLNKSTSFRNIFLSEKLLHSNFMIFNSKTLGIDFTEKIKNGWMHQKVHLERLSIFCVKFQFFIEILIFIRLIKYKIEQKLIK